jgi:tetratricopeptide (TPR) repeat protein
MLSVVPRHLIALSVVLLLAPLAGAGDEPVLPTRENADRFFDLLRRVSPLPGDLRAVNPGSAVAVPDVEEEDDIDLLFGAPRAMLLGGSAGGVLTLAGRRISVKAPVPTAPSPAVREDWRAVIAAIRTGASPTEALARVRAESEDPRTEYLVGLVAFAGRKPGDAAAAFASAAKGEGLRLPALLLEGTARIEAGTPGKAVPPLRAAVAIAPDRPAARALLGEALARCRRMREAAAILAPLAVAKDAAPRTRLLYARALVFTGRPKEAIPHLVALSAAGPHRYGAFVVLGLARLHLKEPKAAIDALDRAQAIRPKALLPAATKVPALKDAGRAGEALKLARSLIVTFPAQGRAWRTAVYAELGAGDPKRALETARKWRTRFPKSIAAALGLVRALLAAGMVDEAEKALESVEKEHPNRPVVERLRKKISESR